MRQFKANGPEFAPNLTCGVCNVLTSIKMKSNRNGFTLVDVMIVVLIIGLLSGIAVPFIAKSRKTAKDTMFISEMRTVVHAFQQYSMLNADYPTEKSPGIMPAEMSEYLPRMDWSATTSIGGKWDWDHKMFGYRAGVSVYKPSRTDDEMSKIDDRVDDGNLSSGEFRKRTDGFMHIVEE